jgi:hypothetical protein
MPITRTKTTIAHTSWDNLAAGNWAGTEIFDLRNTSAHDAIVHGSVATGSSAPTAGDTIDIYLAPFMRDAANSKWYVQGAQGTDGYTTDEALTEGDGGEIKLENLILAASLTLENDVEIEYDFSFGVVATLGYIPDGIGMIVYNGITTNAMGANNDVEITELTYS